MGRKEISKSDAQTCRKCSVEKTVDKFNRDNRLARGYTALCKECRNTQNREYYWSVGGAQVREKNERNTRSWRYRRDYGITIQDYEELYEQQKGCCAICGEVSGTVDRRLHVDHNHTTGSVRGLLCFACNNGLGLFKDSVDRLDKAKTYLQEKGSYG